MACLSSVRQKLAGVESVNDLPAIRTPKISGKGLNVKLASNFSRCSESFCKPKNLNLITFFSQYNASTPLPATG
jgi:hypothetical protein